MSIELDIYVGDSDLASHDLRASLSAHLQQRFVPAPILRWDVAVLRQSRWAVQLAVEEARVECMTYWVPGAGQQERGDLWCSVSAVWRTPESFLLMAIAAAGIATLLDQLIVDEAGLLGGERHLAAPACLDILRSFENTTFPDAARRFCAKLRVADAAR